MSDRALYVMFAEDVESSEALRAPLRDAHIRRRARLAAEGRVVVSGPLWEHDTATADYCGSLLVAAFDSMAQAQAWADDDPYAQALMLLGGQPDDMSPQEFEKYLRSESARLKKLFRRRHPAHREMKATR